MGIQPGRPDFKHGERPRLSHGRARDLTPRRQRTIGPSSPVLMSPLEFAGPERREILVNEIDVGPELDRRQSALALPLQRIDLVSLLLCRHASIRLRASDAYSDQLLPANVSFGHPV